ncbi:MAG: single-stranded DNA-binding protein [Candidatus Edwardsbacteria bacterium]
MAGLRLGELNRVLLMGRLTRDPELRQTPNGTAVTTLGLAINRRFKNSAGEYQDKPTYVNIIAWQRLAELCTQFLHKGSAILVEGRLESRSWETEQGEKRNTLEVRADRIQFLDKLESKPISEDDSAVPLAGEEYEPMEKENLPF